MSESKHTPGPWHVDDSRETRKGKCKIVIRGTESDLVHPVVCRVYMTFEVSKKYYNLTEDEARANARLIASAPDLLAEVTQLRQRNAELREVLGKIVDDGLTSYQGDEYIKGKLIDAARKLLAAEGGVKS